MTGIEHNEPQVDASLEQRTVCIECDLVIRLRELGPKQRATCPRCGHVISARVVDGQTRALAFVLAAALLLILANSFPFLELRANGLAQVMTIPRSGMELYREGFVAIAVLVLLPIMVIPAFLLLAMLALLVPLRRRQPAPWLVSAAKVLFLLNPWSMVEVFVVGVLVSLVKIAGMAKVILGLSFWAYLGFAICFVAAISSLDRYATWRSIEELTK